MYFILELKTQLELQQSELEMSHFSLQQAVFLESDSGESLLWPQRGGMGELSPKHGQFLCQDLLLPILGCEKISALHRCCWHT